MSIVGLNLADLDLLTIIIAYLFLFYGQTATVIFAFGQGILIDLFSGGLHGLFTFLYLCVFGGVYLGSQFFNLQHPRGADDHCCPGCLIEKGDVFHDAHSLLP